jgi:hypothetical protein
MHVDDPLLTPAELSTRSVLTRLLGIGSSLLPPDAKTAAAEELDGVVPKAVGKPTLVIVAAHQRITARERRREDRDEPGEAEDG